MKTLNEKYCYDCAALLPRKAALCAGCGVVQPVLSVGVFAPAHDPLLDRDAKPPARPKKIVAALFALALGGLGLHRVYLGRPASAFIYLLFCWTFVPALIAVVEGIRLLAMSDAKFAARYSQQVNARRKAAAVSARRKTGGRPAAPAAPQLGREADRTGADRRPSGRRSFWL
jgi:TM2 domain-containing membrane protein YozV